MSGGEDGEADDHHRGVHGDKVAFCVSSKCARSQQRAVRTRRGDTTCPASCHFGYTIAIPQDDQQAASEDTELDRFRPYTLSLHLADFDFERRTSSFPVKVGKDG